MLCAVTNANHLQKDSIFQLAAIRSCRGLGVLGCISQKQSQGLRPDQGTCLKMMISMTHRCFEAEGATYHQQPRIRRFRDPTKIRRLQIAAVVVDGPVLGAFPLALSKEASRARCVTPGEHRGGYPARHKSLSEPTQITWIRATAHWGGPCRHPLPSRGQQRQLG